MGWKPLAGFCRDEKIPLADTRARLQSKGIVTTDTPTMREIAEANQIDPPTTLADIVRGVARQ